MALIDRLVTDARGLANEADVVLLGLREMPDADVIVAEVTRRDPTTPLDWCFESTIGSREYQQLKASIARGARSLPSTSSPLLSKINSNEL